MDDITDSIYRRFSKLWELGMDSEALREFRQLP